MSYTLAGRTIHDRRTKSGIGYWEYGEKGQPLVVYLHGNGERGDGSYNSLMALLDNGHVPFTRSGPWGNYNGWKNPKLFESGLRVLCPQLPKDRGGWDVAYIDSFLDEVHTNEPLMLIGWSLGGGGVGRYAGQKVKKHKVTCFITIAAYLPGTGENVDCPCILAHSTNDNVVPVSHSDNYIAKIPASVNKRYERGSGGGHYYMVSELIHDSNNVYDWFKSLIGDQAPQPEPEPEPQPDPEQEGKIILRGGKVFARFADKEVELLTTL